ncbi:hypothetical protein FOZ60_000966 [Perkinsus olseni]|uniref:Uncharacterized protein n=1 Tax=Perkinsus olseni TaxID=32597 RepID=A0A7J6P1G5_PEROL|nr:hypothetical protein FOZ60_000966 [Perkinsus olseni]
MSTVAEFPPERSVPLSDEASALEERLIQEIKALTTTDSAIAFLKRINVTFLRKTREGRKILKDTICEIAVVSRPRECYTFLMEALSLLPDRATEVANTTTFIAAAGLLRGLSRLMVGVQTGRMKSDRARYLVGIVALIQRKFFVESKDGIPSSTADNDAELLEELTGACLELITTYGYDSKVGAAMQEDPKESSCRLEYPRSSAVECPSQGFISPLLGDTPDEYELQRGLVGRLLVDVNSAVYQSPGILQYTCSRVLNLVPHEETGLMQSSDGVSALDMAQSRLGWLVLAYVERPRGTRTAWMPLVWSHAVYTHIYACTIQLLFESNDVLAIRSGLRLYGRELQQHLPYQTYREGRQQRWNPGKLFRHVLEIAVTSDEIMMTLKERQHVYSITEKDLRALPIEERFDAYYQIEKSSGVDEVVGIVLKLYKDDWWTEVLQQPGVVRLSLVDRFTQAIQAALTGDFKVVDGTDTIIGAINWCRLVWLADPQHNATARHIKSSEWLNGVVTSLVENVANQIDAELTIEKQQKG